MSKNHTLKVSSGSGLADLHPGLQDVLKIAYRADPVATEKALWDAGARAVASDLRLDGQIRADSGRLHQLPLPLTCT